MAVWLVPVLGKFPPIPRPANPPNPSTYNGSKYTPSKQEPGFPGHGGIMGHQRKQRSRMGSDTKTAWSEGAALDGARARKIVRGRGARGVVSPEHSRQLRRSTRQVIIPCCLPRGSSLFGTGQFPANFGAIARDFCHFPPFSRFRAAFSSLTASRQICARAQVEGGAEHARATVSPVMRSRSAGCPALLLRPLVSGLQNRERFLLLLLPLLLLMRKRMCVAEMN